jgi:hypothetical protein
LMNRPSPEIAGLLARWATSEGLEDACADNNIILGSNS